MNKKSNIAVCKAGGSTLKNETDFLSFKENIILAFSSHPIFKAEKNIIVCSALSGVTRLLIAVCEAIGKSNISGMRTNLDEINNIHQNIISGLFSHSFFIKATDEFNTLFRELCLRAYGYKFDTTEAELYGHILQYGELMSSKILSLYLEQEKVQNIIVDAREFIKTTGSKNNASVSEEKSEAIIMNCLPPLWDNTDLIITQGFIGTDLVSDKNTVLSLNGSDTSAAFIGYSLYAKHVLFLKDVEGVWKTNTPEQGILSDMKNKDYTERFHNSPEFPVHPPAIEILGRRKIPAYVCHYGMSSIGTCIS